MDKEDFKNKAKKSIDDIFEKINELEAKQDKVKEHIKAEYEEKLNILKTKKKELQAKHEELFNASDEKWDEVKSTFSSAADSFKEGFSKIASLL